MRCQIFSNMKRFSQIRFSNLPVFQHTSHQVSNLPYIKNSQYSKHNILFLAGVEIPSGGRFLPHSLGPSTALHPQCHLAWEDPITAELHDVISKHTESMFDFSRNAQPPNGGSLPEFRYIGWKWLGMIWRNWSGKGGCSGSVMLGRGRLWGTHRSFQDELMVCVSKYCIHLNNNNNNNTQLVTHCMLELKEP